MSKDNPIRAAKKNLGAWKRKMNKNNSINNMPIGVAKQDIEAGEVIATVNVLTGEVISTKIELTEWGKEFLSKKFSMKEIFGYQIVKIGVRADKQVSVGGEVNIQ